MNLFLTRCFWSVFYQNRKNNNNKQTNKTLRHSLTMPGPDGGTAPAREHTAHTEAKETKAHYSAVFLGFWFSEDPGTMEPKINLFFVCFLTVIKCIYNSLLWIFSQRWDQTLTHASKPSALGSHLQPPLTMFCSYHQYPHPEFSLFQTKFCLQELHLSPSSLVIILSMFRNLPNVNASYRLDQFCPFRV